MSQVSIDLSASFKAYDVRGIVGTTITAESVCAVGAAFVDVLGLCGARVLVGGDMRPSSKEFAASFAAGANSRGAAVTDLGLISTDMLYYASGTMDAPGVVFTASHNPAGYNGMKMTRAGAVPLSADTGLDEIRRVAQEYLDTGEFSAHDGAQVHQERIGHVAEGTEPVEKRERSQPAHTSADVLTEYSAYLRSLVDLTGIRPLKMVVDAANGMAGMTTPAVLGDLRLAGLPLEIVPLYFELDGTFPNHPANPLEPENLRDLQQAVLEHGADIGLAFDGDADRCFVIDQLGEAVSPSAITALVARREIARAKAAGEDTPVIIHNLITSRAVPELVRRSGGRAVETRVGHSFIKAVMAEESAVFGGEHSAHYYFRDFFNADTGMLAAMHVLAALGEQQRALQDLVAEYNPYFASGEINSEVEDKAAAMEDAVAAFADRDVAVSRMDGATVSAADGSWWFNLRPSNTEPFLRYNGEAHSQQLMESVRDEVLGIIDAG